MHRVRQGVRALVAFTRTVEIELASQYLSSDQMMLFQQMKRSEQLHSLNVLRDVMAQEQTPEDLAVAALLHDCGKSRYPLAIWQKTLVVLVRALTPALFSRLTKEDNAKWWNRPFMVSVYHPAWSAELVSKTSVSERCLWLIAHHADTLENWRDHPHYECLKRLKQADDAN